MVRHRELRRFLPDNRGRRRGGCHFQHQHLRGFRRVSDALTDIFMARTVPSADPSTVWLAGLIEAAEVLAASAEPCDPAIVRAFSHRLEMPGLPAAGRCAQDHHVRGRKGGSCGGSLTTMARARTDNPEAAKRVASSICPHQRYDH